MNNEYGPLQIVELVLWALALIAWIVVVVWSFRYLWTRSAYGMGVRIAVTVVSLLFFLLPVAVIAVAIDLFRRRRASPFGAPA